jgi:hypothetical protein
MSTISTKITELENQVVETVKSFQEPVVEQVTRVVTFVDDKLPELPKVEALGKLPKADEVIDQQFVFAGQLLEVQRQFVAAIVAALEPLTSQLRPVAAPKVAKVSKAKATEAAA